MLLGTTSTDNTSDTCQSCCLVHEALLILTNNDCDGAKAAAVLKGLDAPAGEVPDFLKAFLDKEGRRSPSVSSLAVTAGESSGDDEDLEGEGLGGFQEPIAEK